MLLPFIETRRPSTGSFPALLAVAALATVPRCGPPSDETLYFVRASGMALPVVERGDATAAHAIIHVHGGPGESRLDTWLGAEARLAEVALYVTWAQRTTPFATGPLRRASATLDQHVDDLHAVVATVHARHPDKRIVLTGFSWGGAMVIDYMASAPPPYVAGFVLVGPLVDARRAIDESWAMLRAHGDARVAAGAEDAEAWREIIDRAATYASALESLAPEAYLEAFVRPRTRACGRMRDNLGLPDNVENRRKGAYARYQLLPPLEGEVLEWMVAEILDLDLTPRLSSIERPALLLWGELDCNSPVAAAAERTLDGLGTLQDDKELRVLPGLPHDVIDSAPAQYAEAVAGFMRGLR